jgi:hypothetical protein
MPTVPSPGPGSYIRDAYGRGLIIQSKVGANPYKFGVVGGADIHNGLSTSTESAFGGDHFGLDPNTMLPRGEEAKKILGLIPTDPTATGAKKATLEAQRLRALERSSAGLTGVWAEENTRDSIFAALKRKETFATSGTRIRVRLFAGWNFDKNFTKKINWVADAYTQGVAMGSDLPVKPENANAPSLIVEAMKDPDGANLDRIQIIKVWLDDGNYREKIFNIALSDARKLNAAKIKPVGNTVDLKTGTYKNSIGAPMLSAVWQDPEFDAAKPGVYYARVLEIPTPRWSTLLAVKNQLPLPSERAATIQEHAWSSPVWYTPATSNLSVHANESIN